MKRSKKINIIWWIVLSLQGVILILLTGFVFYEKGTATVLSPPLDSWQSRYITYQGGWMADRGSIPDDSWATDGDSIELIYGPFIHLDKGMYCVSIDYDCEAEQAYRIYAYENEDRLSTPNEEELRLDPNSKTTTAHFVIKESLDNFEIRILYNGEGHIDVKNIFVAPSSYMPVLLLLIFAVFVLGDATVFLMSYEKDSKGREIWVDVVRGIGIILVLIGHTSISIKWFIFGFHMPLFFILSGYLYKEVNDLKAYAIKLFKNYMIPYYFFAFVCYIGDIIFDIAGSSVEISDELYKLLRLLSGTSPIPMAGPMWFLPALSLSLFLFALIKKIKKPHVEGAILIVAVFCATMYEKEETIKAMLPFSLQAVFMILLFLEAGYLIRRYDLMQKLALLRIRDVVGVLAVVAAAGFYCIIENHTLTETSVDILEISYGNVFLYIIGAVAFSFLIFAITFFLSSFNVIRCHGLRNLLSNIGRHTIFIMAFERFARKIYTGYISSGLPIDEWYIKFLWNCVFIISLYAIWRLIMHFLPKSGFKTMLNV